MLGGVGTAKGSAPESRSSNVELIDDTKLLGTTCLYLSNQRPRTAVPKILARLAFEVPMDGKVLRIAISLISGLLTKRYLNDIDNTPRILVRLLG